MVDMDIKSQLLKLFENNEDGYISGGALAKQLTVSRSYVWKAVVSLRSEGYEIHAATNKGYRLERHGDVLTAAGIAAHLKNADFFHVEVQRTVTSTNTICREKAAAGAPEGYVLAAEEQTAGKGRMGRAFYSPMGRGVYFSLLLRPGASMTDAPLITSAAAVAAARAIEEILGVSVGIKWVNDLYLHGKKVCGILTEAVIGMENGLMESAVIGIGINITAPETGYPVELSGVAAALTNRSGGKDNERRRLIAATLDNLLGYYRNISAKGFIEEYRSRSIITGQDVYVLDSNGSRPARALAIDDDCGLIVRFEDGAAATLRAGEVSVRPGG